MRSPVRRGQMAGWGLPRSCSSAWSATGVATAVANTLSGSGVCSAGLAKPRLVASRFPTDCISSVSGGVIANGGLPAIPLRRKAS
jgi:hypothetical protein